jgi:phage repressor protein C with HTH and peptisase S24 domain
MRHEDVWRAIDTLAAERGLSVSGLARRAGLDATTFNLSKRRTADGRARWPSTESIAKILAATGASLESLTALIAGGRALADPRHRASPRIPLIGFAEAGQSGFFGDGGYPAGAGWDEVDLPQSTDPHAYALAISGDSMQPVYRAGDIIIVSPGAPVRAGDRVVVRTVKGEVMAKLLTRKTAKRIELTSLNPAYPDLSFLLPQIAWIHRVMWATQ